ncbi:MAG: hypothetical protein ACRD2Z_12110 [Thermoanaerobaculia bacterium]
MRLPGPTIGLLLILLAVSGSFGAAQERSPAADPQRPADPGASSGEEETSPASEEPAEERDDEPLLPSVDFYFPEGQMDLKLQTLIKNAFYQGQVKYDFVDGDISAFLRYRYYGYSTIYQIGVFDAIEFPNLERRSNDFTRTRGGLLLLQWPHSLHSRTFLLAELDRYTSNAESFRFSTNRTNTYVRLGHQIGTPNDRRSNAIVGESRAFSEELFTAYQKIGPGAFGLTGALTYAFDGLGGEFRYVKSELEMVKRFETSRRTFLIGRLHAGNFLYSRPEEHDGQPPPDLEPFEEFNIPRPEFFSLDGRDRLRGLDGRFRGTEEIHSTWEFFTPWFLDADRRALGLTWQDWYWVLYGGVGTIGFDDDVYGDFDEYIPDLGIGFESSVRLKNHTFFLAGIVAHALHEEGGLEAHLSVKSYH